MPETGIMRVLPSTWRLTVCDRWFLERIAVLSCPQRWERVSILLCLPYSQQLRRCGAMIGSRSWRHTEHPASGDLLASNRRNSYRWYKIIETYVCVVRLKNMHDSPVVVLFLLQAGCPKNSGSFSSTFKYYCILSLSLPPGLPLKLLDWGCSLGDEALGREADHRTSYCAEFRNMCCCFCTPYSFMAWYFIKLGNADLRSRVRFPALPDFSE